MTSVWQWAVDVVAECFVMRSTVRDVIGGFGRLRGQPVAVRAAVVRMASDVMAARRRLVHALWNGEVPPDLTSAATGMALVLARAVELGQLGPPAAAHAFAVAHYRELDFAPLADADARIAAIGDPQQRFAVRHSLPDWAAARLLQQYGDTADALATALQAPPPRTLRANTLRGTREDLQAALAREGVVARPTPFAPHGLVVEGDADLFATAAFGSGAFEQQDEASQLAALVVLPPPGGRVLDLCAGSGGKTLALAAALQNRGEILATDVHTGRLAELRTRARRAGAGNVRAVAIDDGGPDAVVRTFAARADRILVDAPCSGVGSWRRRPEARWSVTASDLDPIVASQERLLDLAAALLQPGARLVYATCSLLATENELVVQRLLARRPELETVRIVEILGGALARPIADATGTFLSLRPDVHGTDGFFAAVLRPRRRK